MKWTSDFGSEVEMISSTPVRSLVLLALLVAVVPDTVQGQTLPEQEQPTLPRCSRSDGPKVATGTHTSPALGGENEVEVGQVLLDAWPTVIQAGSIELRSPVTFSGRFMFTDFTVTAQAGLTERDAAGHHAPANYDVKYHSEARPRTGFGRPAVWFELGENGTQLIGVLDVVGARGYPIPNAEFDVTRCYLTTGAPRIRRQLSYTGVSRGVISLEYRELSGNLVRPAFTQQLTYDLADGDLIGIRGVRIKVVSATNIGLRYIVERSFSE